MVDRVRGGIHSVRKFGSEVRELLGRPFLASEPDGVERPSKNKEDWARLQFQADRALFDHSGIYKVLDGVLAESGFLATVKQPIPNLRMVPAIWTPRDITFEHRPHVLVDDRDKSPNFFALARWNRRTDLGEGVSSFWGDYYPVETWKQIAIRPDAQNKRIIVSAQEDVIVYPDFWEDPVNLVMLLRWCARNPDFRGTIAENYYSGYNSGMPNYSGHRIHPNFLPGGYFDPSYIR